MYRQVSALLTHAGWHTSRFWQQPIIVADMPVQVAMHAGRQWLPLNLTRPDWRGPKSRARGRVVVAAVHGILHELAQDRISVSPCLYGAGQNLAGYTAGDMYGSFQNLAQDSILTSTLFGAGQNLDYTQLT